MLFVVYGGGTRVLSNSSPKEQTEKIEVTTTLAVDRTAMSLLITLLFVAFFIIVYNLHSEIHPKNKRIPRLIRKGGTKIC